VAKRWICGGQLSLLSTTNNGAEDAEVVLCGLCGWSVDIANDEEARKHGLIQCSDEGCPQSTGTTTTTAFD
jgi:hypothetical protein